VVAWSSLLAADLWQVALAGGGLAPREIAWLAALWGVPVALAPLALRALGRRRETVTAAVLGVGLAVVAAEVALRAIDPGSTWRPAAASLSALATLAAALAARPAFAGRRGRVLAAVALAAAVGGAVAAGADRRSAATAVRDRPGAPGDRPNVLLVVVDTLRADHLGCYGYYRPTSPVLDAFAAAGLLFERAYAQSSWTKPSTASLLTSRLPSQHGAVLESSVLPEAEATLAEVLAGAGYRTLAASGNPWITPEYGFGQGVDRFVVVYDERFVRVTLAMAILRRASLALDGTLRLYNRVKYRVLGELSTTARDVRVVDAALAWLAEPHDGPVFAYLHLMSPHHPYDPPAPFDRFVPDRSHPPVRNHPRKSYDPFERGEPLGAAALADMLARYDGDVLHADAEIGRLLAGLDRLGLGSRTLVVVTADHGEEFFDHENWGHGQSVYDELVRVPLLVRWPGHVPAGGRVAFPVRHLDVLPSILAAAGLPPAPAAAGRDVLGAAGGEPGPEAPAELVYRTGTARMLVSARGERKVVDLRRGAERRTLQFDLTVDPRERRPIELDLEGRALVRRLEALVAAAEAGRTLPVRTTPDPETAERLRALGYGE
jgi:arylsulfatase A-like enzyme